MVLRDIFNGAPSLSFREEPCSKNLQSNRLLNCWKLPRTTFDGFRCDRTNVVNIWFAMFSIILTFIYREASSKILQNNLLNCRKLSCIVRWILKQKMETETKISNIQISRFRLNTVIASLMLSNEGLTITIYHSEDFPPDHRKCLKDLSHARHSVYSRSTPRNLSASITPIPSRKEFIAAECRWGMTRNGRTPSEFVASRYRC